VAWYCEDGKEPTGFINIWEFLEQLNEYKLKVMVEWLTLLLPIWEGPGSNLDPEIGYSDRFFSVFLSLSRQIP
jgi:hypothetical protein